MNLSEQLDLYRQQMGDEATLRQVVDADSRLACCGWLRVEGHHPDCKSHPKRRSEKVYRKFHGDDATKGAV